MVLFTIDCPNGTSIYKHYRLRTISDVNVVSQLQSPINVTVSNVNYSIYQSALITNVRGQDLGMNTWTMIWFDAPTDVVWEGSANGVNWNTIGSAMHFNQHYGNYYTQKLINRRTSRYIPVNQDSMDVSTYYGTGYTISAISAIKTFECTDSTLNAVSLDYYNWVTAPAPPQYTWSSVPSISGKNGILQLSTHNDINDGEPITTQDETKITLQNNSNVGTIVTNVINNW